MTTTSSTRARLATAPFAAPFATVAIAALALTGCVRSIEDESSQDQATTEQTQAQETAAPEAAQSTAPATTASESPSGKATASASSSASADSAEAPGDLSEGDISSALSTEIDGYRLIALTPSQLESTGVDLEAEISSALGTGIGVAPVSCEDPFLGSFLAGVQDVEESVVAVDEEGSLLVTVRAFDDAAAAEQAFQEQRDALQECGTVELTVDGTSGQASVEIEDLTVDGATGAYEAAVSADGTSFINPSMAYGNTVVSLATTEQYAGGPAPDNQALLGEVAQALSAP